MTMPLHDCRLPDGVLLHVEHGLQGGAVRRHLEGEVALPQQDAAPFAAAAAAALPGGGELEGDAGGVVVGGVDEGREAVARKGGGSCAGGKFDDCIKGELYTGWPIYSDSWVTLFEIWGVPPCCLGRR